jgi:hypothetical protein
LRPCLSNPLSLLVGGDLVLDEPDADHWLAGIAPAVRAADLAIGIWKCRIRIAA